MRRVFIIFCCSIIFMGCIRQNNTDLTVVVPILIELTSTVSTSSATLSSINYTTTPSPTLSPIIWINTPTSDFQNIKQVLSTPAVPASCPTSNTAEIAIPTELPLNDVTITNILNKGGVEQLVRLLSKDDVNFRYEDLTNDGIRELIVRNWLENYLAVFGCQNGEYVNLLTVDRAFERTPGIVAIKDINLDGVKELVIEMITCHWCTGMKVYEWNGKNFESLVRDWYFDDQANSLEYYDIANLAGITAVSIEDIDNNSTYELILDGGVPSYIGGWTGWDGPWRKQKLIYMWDGKYYVQYSREYDTPNFRFEAIQDGDVETTIGDYDSALKSYQAAIFDDKLKSWTKEAWRNLLQKNEEAQSLVYPDIKNMPFNQNEYDQLSAYARYRIMIIYLKQGWESDAKIVYETLLEKYPRENSGYPYVELAKEFWNEFQSSRNLILSCDKAIDYAVEHRDILEPLGDHGLFDFYYLPSDICPFR